ncbi:MAG: tRNA (adenosine(37)-N6)-threonylcarbamoyltransferase complex dimerization subunit type 1 TsaB [Pseudomonadota bacterium]|nr:tRNA (adenosine(37)-N6)-threonylcarbamoyltransferase complex dimerization subunit type 1 TsaB [Pseudomonadota bacterium]
MTAILALDTATGPCSVAVWKDGCVVAYLETLRPASQSACLVPMIEQALKESRLEYQDFSAVAATVGPGSFTGIRVGLAAAAGIAFSSPINRLGFTTLETLAFGARQQAGRILAILNAGKNEVYYQLFEAGPWRALSEPALGPLEQAMTLADKALVVGNALPDAPPTYPRADALAQLTATHAAKALSLSPFYIRPPDAKLPSQKA